MIGYYNYTVILTYLSLIFSAFGITRVFSGGENHVFAAIFCLMLSGVCDMLDGVVAARRPRKEEEKLFGIQIDSLCDLVAFGVLPAVICLDLAGNTRLARVAAILLILASVIRLGFFNVQETMRNREEKRKVYLGLPVTLVSLLLPFFLLLNLLFHFRQSLFLPICLLVFAACEVSRIPIRKPYGVGKLLMILFGIAVFTCLILFSKELQV